jgi:hypothetical protein
MTVAAPELEEEALETRAPTPQVFVRTFATPPGLPWDQARAAQLDARHGAPLPISDLLHRVKRLDRWTPGRSGAFAVFYVRRRDFDRPFETTVDVDGQAVRVAFGMGAGQIKRARQVGLTALIVIAAVAVVVTAVSRVWQARSQNAEQLSTLEREAAARLSQAQKLDDHQHDDEALARLEGKSGLASDVAADLSWLAAAKTPDARIVAVHWDHGLLAVESRGEGAPVAAADRQVVKSQKPIRPGVWLWGIGRSRATPGDPGRAAAAGG